MFEEECANICGQILADQNERAAQIQLARVQGPGVAAQLFSGHPAHGRLGHLRPAQTAQPQVDQERHDQNLFVGQDHRQQHACVARARRDAHIHQATRLRLLVGGVEELAPLDWQTISKILSRLCQAVE